MSIAKVMLRRMQKAVRTLALRPSEWAYLWQAKTSGMFDATFYRGANPALHPFYRLFPLHHFILQGEATGMQPNPEFSPAAYLRLNPDVAESGMRPFRHFLSRGQKEGRPTRAAAVVRFPDCPEQVLRFDPHRKRAPVAVVVHVYYPDLWPEFRARLKALKIDYDLYVTLTWRGAETDDLAGEISAEFPKAEVVPVANKGRDILPFITLLNAGAFDGYKAVCKIHTKKSPHRNDGAEWRQHLIDGILPHDGLGEKLDGFLADPDAGFWVADGQYYKGAQWWGSNRDKTTMLLRRLELDGAADDLSFPAGSMYWIKPLMLGMIRALRLDSAVFEAETGQVDGTLAHAFERAIGGLAQAAGMAVRQSSEIGCGPMAKLLAKPSYTSAFYLPQFHPIAENDAWWGAGYTEWRAALGARSMFPGHLQPMLPADLGYYDLRAPEVMGQQAELAAQAGIDAFCVYHYWFDGKRVLETPLDNLLKRPDVAFPFYLCWANESWRRNWDGLSGEVLLDQSYRDGFEKGLVQSSLPYMRDERYQRPDGTRPRFVIYRPEDMPDPARNIARMRKSWQQAGIGEVELGAVSFHVKGKSEVAEDLFDFWVEMPPHGLVKGEDFLFGGPLGNRMGGATPADGFGGLIYDYNAVARRSVKPSYRRQLPDNTIAGIMPGWDNTARRGPKAHIAHGANPTSFRHWLRAVQEHRLDGSYRGELFINAWNEWAEKAVLEPSETFGRMYLDVLKDTLHNG